jgi:hypothetical protein
MLATGPYLRVIAMMLGVALATIATISGPPAAWDSIIINREGG